MSREPPAKRARRAGSPVEDEVPRRLRAARQARSITVRELARRLHVSPSAISQIETGRTRPSVSTLYAMVSELGTSLDDLFASEDGRRRALADGDRSPGPTPAESSPLDETARPGNGRSPSLVQRQKGRVAIELESGVRWERLTATPDPDVDFMFVTYPPSSSSSPSGTLMRHSGREYGVLIAGHLSVSMGFETYDLDPGDSISFDSTVPHLLRNLGNEPAIAVWVVLGRGEGTPGPGSSLLSGPAVRAMP